MKQLLLLLGLLAAAFLLPGCTEPEPPPPPPPLPAPDFTRSDDPKAFFEDYLEDLRSDRFLPGDLVELLTGQTDLAVAVKEVGRHHTSAFLEWYFAEDYLKSVRQAVEGKLDNLEYQLGILRVSRDDAAPVLMVIHSGIVEQKEIVEAEDYAQEWEEGGESFRIRLSGGGMETLLLLFREQGLWKLGVLGKAVEIAQ